MSANKELVSATRETIWSLLISFLTDHLYHPRHFAEDIVGIDVAIASLNSLNACPRAAEFVFHHVRRISAELSEERL